MPLSPAEPGHAETSQCVESNFSAGGRTHRFCWRRQRTDAPVPLLFLHSLIGAARNQYCCALTLLLSLFCCALESLLNLCGHAAKRRATSVRTPKVLLPDVSVHAANKRGTSMHMHINALTSPVRTNLLFVGGPRLHHRPYSLDLPIGATRRGMSCQGQHP